MLKRVSFGKINTSMRKLASVQSVVVSLFLILCCNGDLQAEDPGTELNLEKCIQRGLKESTELKSYALQIDEAVQGINESYGNFLPNLGVTYNYGRLINDDTGESDTDFIENQNQTLTIRLSQPLFTGLSGVVGVKKAKLYREYQKVEYLRGQLLIIDRIVTSFYDKLLAKKRMELLNNSIDRLNKQREIVSAWVKQRMAPKLRLMEIEVELSTAKHRLIKSKSEADIAKARLAELLVVHPDQNFEISGTFDSPMVLVCDQPAECRELALNNRPELKTAEINLKIAGLEGREILALNMPQVRLDGSWVDYNRKFNDPIETSADESYDEEKRDYFSVMLNVSFEPFQGGRNISAYRRQRIVQRRLQQVLITTKRKIMTEVEVRFSQREDSQAAIVNNSKRVEEAKNTQMVANKSAVLGVGSLRDVLNAEIRLTAAQISLEESKYSFCLATNKLVLAVAEDVIQ